MDSYGIAESFAESTNSQNLESKLTESRIQNPQNLESKIAESRIQNPQNLIRKNVNPPSILQRIISHEVRKSFCYFWLLPKVESPLPHQPQSTKQRIFTESSAESALDSPSNSLDSFRKKGYHPPTLPPTIFKCFPKSSRFSLLGGVPRLSVSSKKSAGGTSAPLIPDFFAPRNGRVLGANARFKNRFCFAESHTQKSAESHTQKRKSALDSTSQNLTRKSENPPSILRFYRILKKFLLLLVKAKK